MRPERIAFSERAESNWHEIISEADRSESLPNLIWAARSHYPDDQQLRVAAEACLADIDSAGTALALPAPVDLAVIAAMPEELHAFLDVAGRPEAWHEFALDGFIHRRGELPVDGSRIQVVAGSLWKYGANPTSAEVARLRSIRPRMLAMVGICAGREGEDELPLGDVVVADRAFNPGEGKWKEAGFHPDVQTFQPPAWLVQQLRDFAAREGWAKGMTTPRPARLGRRSPNVFVAPFASDDPIVAVESPFDSAARVVRKVMAYELEVKAFLSAAAEYGIPAIVVKAVSDHGTPVRDPGVRPYALEAAARWLSAFVKATSRHWPV
jgi:nucleoside phosphorylase